MKKIILVLGLMLGVCLGAYGYISQRDVNDLYTLMNRQHEEHPGWVSIQVSGSREILGDFAYYIGQWCGYYGYEVEDIVPVGPNRIEVFILNEILLEENGYIYDRESKQVVELYYDDYSDY